MCDSANGANYTKVDRTKIMLSEQNQQNLLEQLIQSYTLKNAFDTQNTWADLFVYERPQFSPQM